MWLFFLGICGFYFVFRSLYRLYFHPLRKFPGPKLAAITQGYEFYYDVFRGGMYIWEIEKMHQKYGPVVRINPRELHIKDPYYYDEICAPSSRKREKDPKFVACFGMPSAIVATVGHDLHRFRRGLLNNFFSKRSVVELSPILHEKKSKLMQRFEKAYKNNNVVDLADAFGAFTADLISQYSWGVSAGFLDNENFNKNFRQAANEMALLTHVFRLFPILLIIEKSIPRWLTKRLKPKISSILDMQDMVAQQATPQKKPVETSTKTIFKALSDPDVPPQERSPRRLEDEGLQLIAGGSETTARALTLAAFYLYQNKPLIMKLRKELRPIMPTPTTEASWTQLEQLPYMKGVVNEAIRLSHGIIFRSPRVAPTESLTYKGLVIPPGSPVSMSSYFVLTDPEVFPDPESFKPERWIQATEQGQNLTQFLVAFSKGSRMCLGINLAYAELYITIASLVRRFDMELFETTIENIRTVREFGVGYPKEGNFSVRAKFTKVVKE
ncbi:hypothetical protein MMC31_007466 [Peltigera leucophlebia]|nr:hypothetical protein [Peltigera leucophlebia]